MSTDFATLHGVMKWRAFWEHANHKFKYGGRSPRFIWAPCHVMCTLTAVLNGWDPAIPPHLDSYTGALLASKETTSLCNPLMPTLYLLRVRAAVHVDDQSVLLSLTEVRGQVQSHLHSKVAKGTSSWISALTIHGRAFSRPRLFTAAPLHDRAFSRPRPQSTYFPRDETGLVCLPTQLERTQQFYWWW